MINKIQHLPTSRQGRGLIIVATSDFYILLARQLIHRLRGLEPVCHITLFISTDIDLPLNLDVSIVKIQSPHPSWGDKIKAIRLSPYEETIYLDVDILPTSAFLSDLFSLFNIENFAVAALPGMGFNEPWEKDLYPAAIPQFNTGVLIIKMSRCTELLQCWQDYYCSFKAYGDQESFRAAALDTLITITPLAPEYNCLPDSFVNTKPLLLHFTGSAYKNSLFDQEFCNQVVELIEATFMSADTLGCLLMRHRPKLLYSAINGGWSICS